MRPTSGPRAPQRRSERRQRTGERRRSADGADRHAVGAGVGLFQLRGLDAQRRLLDATIGAYQTALQLTTNRYNQGVVSGSDVAQAQTQLEMTRAQATDLGVARAELEHAIAILDGTPPAALTIAAAAGHDPPPALPMTLPAGSLNGGPMSPVNGDAARRRSASPERRSFRRWRCRRPAGSRARRSGAC